MKTAIVSGASGGIGIKIAERFIKDGYFVVALYNKNGSAFNDLKSVLPTEEEKCRLIPLKADLTSERETDAALEKVFLGFKHIDVLVNNAGIDLYKLLTDTKVTEWDKVFALNVRSAFILSKAVLPKMIERKSGNIVNVSSIWGKVGASMETAYSASKAALIGLTKALSKEVAESGIRVNCVCPGVIDTKMNSAFSKPEMDEIIERTPLKRIGKPEEIASLISFIVSDSASFITGETITADGGFTV